MTILYALLSALAISAVSLIGVFFLLSKEELHGRKMHLLLALAAGAMLGNALLHMLPHALTLEQSAMESHNPPAIVQLLGHHEHDHDQEHDHDAVAGHEHEHDHDAESDHDHDAVAGQGHDQDHDKEHAPGGHGHTGMFTSIMLLAGMLFFYAFDLLIQRDESEGTKSVGSEGWMVLAADMVENLLDGVVVGTAYAISVPVGIAATITILLHEIPLELGDYAVLRHSGFSRTRALTVNFLSGLVSVVGVMVALVLGMTLDGFALYMTPLAAGGFLYIAGSILVPRLRSQCCDNSQWQYLLVSMIGVAVMVAILFFE